MDSSDACPIRSLRHTALFHYPPVNLWFMSRSIHTITNVPSNANPLSNAFTVIGRVRKLPYHQFQQLHLFHHLLAKQQCIWTNPCFTRQNSSQGKKLRGSRTGKGKEVTNLVHAELPTELQDSQTQVFLHLIIFHLKINVWSHSILWHFIKNPTLQLKIAASC